MPLSPLTSILPPAALTTSGAASSKLPPVTFNVPELTNGPVVVSAAFASQIMVPLLPEWFAVRASPGPPTLSSTHFLGMTPFTVSPVPNSRWPTELADAEGSKVTVAGPPPR